MREQDEEGENKGEDFRVPDTIHIGDITITSHYFKVNELAGFLLTLLKKKQIKEYLKLYAIKKASQNYLG